MRVCDVHRDRESVNTLQFTRSDEWFDICGECEETIRAALLRKPAEPAPEPEEAPAKRRGRPPK